MSPCLVLYVLAALAGAVLGGPTGLLAAAFLVAVVLSRHLLARRLPGGRVAGGGAP